VSLAGPFGFGNQREQPCLEQLSSRFSFFIVLTLHEATHPRPAFHCFASLSPAASERSAGIAKFLISSTIRRMHR
jgi:hypothetical protein